jgi:hypothetical protein
MMTDVALSPRDFPHGMAAWSLPAEIERFLAGESDGAGLFRALYDSVLDEKVPERLSALCRPG